MRNWLLVLIACGGCRQIFGLSDPIDGHLGDGPHGDSRGDGRLIDTPPADGTACFGATPYTVCLSALPALPVTLSGSIDTDSDMSNPTCHNATSSAASFAVGGQPQVCFIVGTTITVSADAQAFGDLPLVLVATQSITISAKLDASGAGGFGGGNNCGGGATGASGATGGGGGAGGSFMTKGCDGGNGAAGLAGLAAAAASPPTRLQSGCRGRDGGDGATAGNHGTGGSAGGALYLVAGSSININASGTIDVSGSPGRAGMIYSGGGGGGTGGMIVLHAPAITAASGARVFANGAGGAAGGTAAGNGVDGSSPSSPIVAAAGGTGGGGNGGNGGNGNTASNGGMTGAASTTQGGGGGGGGGGYIQSNFALANATTSPNPVIQ